MIKFYKIILLAVVAICSLSCGKDDDANVVSEWVAISSTSVAATVESVNLEISTAVSGRQYSVEIVQDEEFASFSISQTVTLKEGTVSSSRLQNIIYIYLDTNTTEEARQAKFVVTLGSGESESFTLTQKGTTGSSGSGGSDGSGDSGDSSTNSWAEIPVIVDNDNYQYVTHFTTLNSKSVRNYSMCFDKKNYAARWVAFPYHKVYDGDVGRNESWQYDPQIDTEYQPNLSSSYNGSYDRGHQLASADRQATTEMNKQTFYYSNMTPQLGTLNQQKWATVEGLVRDQVCSDTLYVVTGADYSSTIGYTNDASGKSCPLPTGYYKVMLRTINGSLGKAISECSASELKAIGYYFEHRSYSSIPTPVSVATIEDMVGFTFFPTAPESVKNTYSVSQWNGL